MKYQALRPHFFSVVGGWRVLGVGGWWQGGSCGGCVVVGWVMGWMGGVGHGVGGHMGHGMGGWVGEWW